MGTDSNSIADGASSTPRGIRAALRRVHPVWWLNLAIWAAAIALFAGPVAGLPPLHEPHVAWWWLALGFLVGERCVVHLEFSRNAHSFSLGDVPLVFGLVLASGGDLVIAAVVGPALTLLLDRRLPPIKLVLQPRPVRALGLPGHDHLLLARARRDRLGPAAGDRRARRRAGQRDHLRRPDRRRDLAQRGLARPALAHAHVRDRPHRHGHQLEPRPRRRADRLDRAVGAAAAGRAAADRLPRLPRLRRPSASAASGSSSSTRPTARCRARPRSPRRSRACWPARWTPSAPSAPRSSCGRPTSRRCARRSARATTRRSWPRSTPRSPSTSSRWSPTTRPVVTLPDAARGSAVADYLQERGVHKAMLAMLPGEDRVIGTLMLSNRYGVVRDFSADDLKLFETLANNASRRAAVRPPRAGDRAA